MGTCNIGCVAIASLSFKKDYSSYAPQIKGTPFFVKFLKGFANLAKLGTNCP